MKLLGIAERTFQNRIFIIYSSICLLLIITSCIETTTPGSKVYAVYTNPKVSNYQFEKIAILPMLCDDTTDTGTFYSTNHFINQLAEKFPKIKFEIPDISNIISADSLHIPKLIDSIEKNKSLNLPEFYLSNLGDQLYKDSYDAMFLGTIDSCENIEGSGNLDWKLSHLSIERLYSRNCFFRYYLISLIDGRVLWKAAVLGENNKIIESDVFTKAKKDKSSYYPPLDIAISNGIDLMIPTIPNLIKKQ